MTLRLFLFLGAVRRSHSWLFLAAALTCSGAAASAEVQDQDGPVRTSRDRPLSAAEAAAIAPTRAVKPIAADTFAWLTVAGGKEAQEWRDTQKKQVDAWLTADKNYPVLLNQAGRDRGAPEAITIAAGRVYEATAALDGQRSWRSAELAAFVGHREKWRPEFEPGASNLICEARSEHVCLVTVSRPSGLEFDDYTPAAPGLSRSSFDLPPTVGSVVFDGENAVLATVREGGRMAVRRLARGQAWSAATTLFSTADPGQTVEPKVAWSSDGREVIWLTARSNTAPPKLYVFAAGEFRPFAAPAGSEIAGVTGAKLIVRLTDGWPGDAGAAGLPPGALIDVDLGPLLNRTPQLTPRPILKLEGRPDIRNVVATPSGLLVLAHEGREDVLYLCTPGLRGWEVRRLPSKAGGALTVTAVGGSAATVILEASDYPNGRSRLGVDTGSGLVELIETTPDFDPKAYSKSTYSTKGLDGAQIDYAVLRKADAPTTVNAALLLAQPKTEGEIGAALSVGRLWLESGGTLIVPVAHHAVYDPKNVQVSLLIDYEDLSAIARDAAARKLPGAERIALAGSEASGLTAAVDLVKHPTQWAGAVLIDPLTDPLRLRVGSESPAWLRAYAVALDPGNRSYWDRLAPYDNLLPGRRYAATLTIETPAGRAAGASDGPRFTARMNSVEGGSLAVQAAGPQEASALAVAFLLRLFR